ncbi:hypothetical protein [Galenea microaerophila]
MSATSQEIHQIAQQYDQEEAFEVGRQKVRQWLPTEAAVNYDYERLEALAKSLHSDEARVAFYWFAYFTARMKIEQSYDFLQAFQLFDLGSAVLDQIAAAEALPEKCDRLQQKLMVRLVKIDRGIHNNDFKETVDSCNELLQMLEAYPACQTRFSAEYHYLVLMRVIAQLLMKRDAGEDSVEEWLQVRAQLETLYHEYDAKGLTIISSILQAFLMALPVWQQAGENRLQVTRGRALITFYATLNSLQTEGLAAALNHDSKRQALMQALHAEAFYEPEPPDILSDLSFHTQFHVWQFDLPEVHLPQFRHKGLHGALQLRVNSLGLLQLTMEVPIEGWDVNALRHLMNLPLENALDEPVQWQGLEVHYLREVAQTIFDRFDHWLDQNKEQACLVHSVSHDVNFTLLVEAAQDKQHALLTPEQFYAHPDWNGLKVPPREVRSVYENWRMQTAHKGVQNVALDLYHHQDWVQADGHYALIVQLDQPTWVTEQAVENVQVVTGLRYFMKQTGEVLFANINQIQKAFNDETEVQEASPRALRQQEKIYRQRIQRLHRIGIEIKSLLQLLDNGGLMRFPDHGRFVSVLMQTTGVVEQRSRMQQLLKESQEMTRYLRLQISQALEALEARSKARFEGTVAFLGALISVSALSDVFQTFEAAGIQISGWVQLEWMLGLMVFLGVYFSLEALIRKFR